MEVSKARRIVLLGKSGAGKSSLANTILGQELFLSNSTSNSGTKKCQAECKSLNGWIITLIDTPGFFDTDMAEEELRSEILRCITECAPGPHAFLIVLKVEKFTEQEQAVINQVCQYFSPEALKYATVVFTHGDDLPEGQKIQDFVSQNQGLKDVVDKCGGRCHIFDNKYWKNSQEGDYRSNKFQVGELLNSIEEAVKENNENCFTNEMLQEVEKERKSEEDSIRRSSKGKSEEEIRQQAKDTVFGRLLKKLESTHTGVLLASFFGVTAKVVVVILSNSSSQH